MGTMTFAVSGEWGGLTPGYYEIKTTSGKLHKTSTSYRFELRPGTDFKAGDQLMMRMVSKNGVSSNWVYWDLNVLPKPKIMGVTVDVRYQYGYYTMTLATPFGEIMGGAIEPLEDIPYLVKQNLLQRDAIIYRYYPQAYKHQPQNSGGGRHQRRVCL